VQQPEDLGAVQIGNGNSDNAPATISGIGIRNAPRQVQDVVTRRGRFQKLTDELEHRRLHSALAARFVSNNKKSISSASMDKSLVFVVDWRFRKHSLMRPATAEADNLSPNRNRQDPILNVPV
jgi:hypothetical protein